MKGFLLTLAALLAFPRQNNGQTKLILLPRYPFVYVGDAVNLQCKGTGEPITWKINGTVQEHKDSLMVLTVVTQADSGKYTCERNGQNSSLQLTVLNLEPYAQLFLPAGGAVIAKGDARVLTLQVDEELDKWKCYAFRNNTGFMVHIQPDGLNMGRVYADLKDSRNASFWCKKTKSTHRSNVVTLMMTERMVMLEPATPVQEKQTLTLRCAVWGGGKVTQAYFYKNDQHIITARDDIYTIPNASNTDNGQYKCKATYRFSHISAKAVQRIIESDPQEIKVIDEPPVAFLTEISVLELKCSCSKPNCSKYHWYHTDNSKTRRRLNETALTISVDKDGTYTCRADCGYGFSRFSKDYIYTEKPGGGGTLVVIMIAFVVILLGLICVLVAGRYRRRQRNRMKIIEDGKKDKSGRDYEEMALSDEAVYHTLGEGTEGEKTDGGYQALKKTEGDKAVYQTLGEGTEREKTDGGYQALKKTEGDKAVYHTLGADEKEGQDQGQGGYEALQTVKAQVYQTLSTEKPEGKAEGGYEQLPQKIRDEKVETIEENPYEEIKGEKQKKGPTELKK